MAIGILAGYGILWLTSFSFSLVRMTWLRILLYPAFLIADFLSVLVVPLFVYVNFYCGITRDGVGNDFVGDFYGMLLLPWIRRRTRRQV